jgi:hypothetical protein
MPYGDGPYGFILYGATPLPTAATVSVHKGKRFERWRLCDICGFSYPVSQLMRDQWGRLVCSGDVDEPSNEDFQRDGNLTTAPSKPPWPE